jgi:hypothetical protein
MQSNEEEKKETIEYILVADKISKIILSTKDRKEAKMTANRIRQAGGEVTIFRSLTL